MNHCIKCGTEIPEGELFCQECSLNAGSTMFEETQTARHHAPVGKMQTPVPVSHVHTEHSQSQRKKKSSRGLKVALALVTVLLLGALGFLGSQYGDIQQAKNRLRTKEADVALRLQEVEDLESEIADLTSQLDTANATVEQQDHEIQELMQRLSTSQSSQSQGEYDLTQTERELQRLENENMELLALSDDLKAQIDDLKAQVEVLTPAQAKADFLDKYVVFVEDDDSGFYHSYDCSQFSKKDFWAFSRKLAEHEGYTPCPICHGLPQAEN